VSPEIDEHGAGIWNMSMSKTLHPFIQSKNEAQVASLCLCISVDIQKERIIHSKKNTGTSPAILLLLDN